MLAAGFRIESMIELPFDKAIFETNPAYQFYPEAVAGGIDGLPFVVIWEASLS